MTLNRRQAKRVIADLHNVAIDLMSNNAERGIWSLPIIFASYIENHYLGIRSRIDWDSWEALEGNRNG